MLLSFNKYSISALAAHIYHAVGKEKTRGGLRKIKHRLQA